MGCLWLLLPTPTQEVTSDMKFTDTSDSSSSSTNNNNSNNSSSTNNSAAAAAAMAAAIYAGLSSYEIWLTRIHTASFAILLSLKI